MEATLELLKWLGLGSITVVALLGAAWGFFKFFSKKWLENKFARQLADHQHSLQRELENVRLELNKLFDRSVKLHQREFESLPEAWGLLVEAYGITKAVVSPLQQYADVGRMNEAQLDDFLDVSDIEEWQKQELKLADDKNEYYRKAIDWYKFRNAYEVTREFHIYRLKHGIFMLPDIQKNLENMDDFIFQALRAHRHILEYGIDKQMMEDREVLENEGEEVIKKLETQIRERLWS